LGYCHCTLLTGQKSSLQTVTGIEGELTHNLYLPEWLRLPIPADLILRKLQSALTGRFLGTWPVWRLKVCIKYKYK